MLSWRFSYNGALSDGRNRFVRAKTQLIAGRSLTLLKQRPSNSRNMRLLLDRCFKHPNNTSSYKKQMSDRYEIFIS